MLLSLDPVQVPEELLRLDIVSDIEYEVKLILVFPALLKYCPDQLVLREFLRYDLDLVLGLDDLNRQVFEDVGDL